MKVIARKWRKRVAYSTLEPGEVFFYEDMAFMRLSSGQIKTAVNLVTGITTNKISGFTQVEKVQGRFLEDESGGA